MKKSQITLGATYAMLVSGAIVPVRIVGLHRLGGWIGENRITEREVRVRSAQRCRYEMEWHDGQWRRKQIPAHTPVVASMRREPEFLNGEECTRCQRVRCACGV